MSVPGKTMAGYGACKGRTTFQKSLAAPSLDDSDTDKWCLLAGIARVLRGFPSGKNPSRSDNIDAYRQGPALEKEPMGGGITCFTS